MPRPFFSVLPSGNAPMPSLRSRQVNFLDALFDPNKQVPDGITGPSGRPAGTRFNVYRNNVASSLIDALEAVYPAVRSICGSDFFREMARQFALANPPTSPVLIQYGAGFSNFIDTFEPAGRLDYLSDVARLEWAWSQAYHAADCELADPSVLTGLQPDQISGLRVVFHPSVQILSSRHPAVSLWNANVATGDPQQDALSHNDIKWQPETGLIYRSGLEVHVRVLPVGFACFLQSLQAGQTLLAAMQAAIDEDAGFDPETAMNGMLALNVLVEFNA